MPLIWGYYHKLIKWADTFWRLALKPGLHSQMEQFQSAVSAMAHEPGVQYPASGGQVPRTPLHI